jgi:hypothetical protein
MTANAARDFTAAEIAERKAFLRQLRNLPPRPSADVIPIGSQRKPLGLGIVTDDNDDDAEDDPTQGWQGFHFGEGKTKEFLEGAIRTDWLFHYLDIVGGALLEVHNDGVREFNGLQDDLKRKFNAIEAARRVEVAELKTVVAELRAEIHAMRSIQEASRIASRGERGEQGVRGIPGPPGSEGKVGPKGPRGETGPAAKVAAWEPDPAAFSLTPIYLDGKRGVSANLRPFFEHYDQSTRGDEDEA